MLLSATSISQQPTKRKREQEGAPTAGFSVHSHKKKILKIEIPSFITSPLNLSAPGDHDNLTSSPATSLSQPDSLFDEPATLECLQPNRPSDPRLVPALLSAPLIPGLFFTPSLRLSEDVANEVMRFCLTTYFQTEGVNQIMLFGRFSETEGVSSFTGLPPVLLSLLSTLETMLLPHLPSHTHSLLFPPFPRRARQAILNLYQPGQGISPHVDLLKRFGDGIVGVSLGSGCVMQFAEATMDEQVTKSTENSTKEEKEKWDVYLPERSVIVLSEEARYRWTHGIEKHKEDYVSLPGHDGLCGQWIKRGVRLSITFRWLLPGADIVGETDVMTPP